MKQLFILFIGPLAFANGQDTIKPLLVREVYDFQVGDIFQYNHAKKSYKGGQDFSEYSYSQMIILERKQTKDTLFYTKEIKEKKQLEPDINIYIQIDTITNLDSSIFSVLKWPLPNNVDKTQYKTTNIVYYAANSYGGGIYCSNTIQRAIPISGPSYKYSRYFMKGLGLTGWNYNQGYYPPEGVGVSHINSISYYKKKNKTYGVPKDFTVSNKDKFDVKEKISIYPNPTSDKITIKGLDEIISKSYTIYDLNGNMLHTALLTTNTIHIKSILPSGVYCFQFFETETKKVLNTQTIIIQ